jgi:hypothetical protein
LKNLQQFKPLPEIHRERKRERLKQKTTAAAQLFLPSIGPRAMKEERKFYLCKSQNKLCMHFEG